MYGYVKQWELLCELPTYCSRVDSSAPAQRGSVSLGSREPIGYYYTYKITGGIFCQPARTTMASCAQARLEAFPPRPFGRTMVIPSGWGRSCTLCATHRGREVYTRTIIEHCESRATTSVLDVLTGLEICCVQCEG